MARRRPKLLHLAPRLCMILKPLGKTVYVEPVFRYFKRDVRELLGRRREFVACQEEIEDASLKAGSLVAVYEGMPLDDGLHERSSFCEGCREALCPSVGDLWARR